MINFIEEKEVEETRLFLSIREGEKTVLPGEN